MQKALALVLFFTLCCFTGRGAILYAQSDAPGVNETAPDEHGSGDSDSEDEGSSPTDSEVDIYMPDKYAKGDQTVTICLGAVFPVLFFNDGKIINHKITPPVGGTLSLAYTRFLGSHFFVGAEVGFISLFTLSENALFIIPIGARAGWQFVFRRFEFPLYVAIGMAPQKYLDFGYFGMYLKGAVSAYWRYNQNWSFGLTADWSWFPQWPKEDGVRIPSKDVHANIIGVNLSVRYHF